MMTVKKLTNENSTRNFSHHNIHHMRGGVLTPVQIEPVREGEGGIYRASIVQELAPMPIRLLNEFKSGTVSVYVPLQAILMQAFGDVDDMAGTAEFARRKLTSGAPLFGLINDVPVAKDARIVPRKVAGVDKVNNGVTFAHAAAVNFLRQRKYVDIDTIPLGSGLDASSPCLFSDSVLDRLGGVLDPDDRINGRVDLTGDIPVQGIGMLTADGFSTTDRTVKETGGTTTTVYDSSIGAAHGGSGSSSAIFIEEDPDNLGFPNIKASLSGSDGISLKDFYQSEMRESIARQIREMVDRNPQYGEEMALRWSAGLSVNVGAQPFLLYENESDFGSIYQQGTESTGLFDGGTKGVHAAEFTVPIPKTEFGGVIVTFTYVKPDEAIANQPHPFWGDVWSGQNFAKDKLMVDPVPVAAAEVDNTVLLANEGTRVMYIGYNGLKKAYQTAGWSRATDLDLVAEKSSLWQIDVPMSLTPENMIYPTSVDHYPFADTAGHAVTVNCFTELNLVTPMVFGPSPVENVGLIDDGLLDLVE